MSSPNEAKRQKVEPKQDAWYKLIEVEGCGVPEANGIYKPISQIDDEDYFDGSCIQYSKQCFGGKTRFIIARTVPNLWGRDWILRHEDDTTLLCTDLYCCKASEDEDSPPQDATWFGLNGTRGPAPRLLFKRSQTL